MEERGESASVAVPSAGINPFDTSSNTPGSDQNCSTFKNSKILNGVIEHNTPSASPDTSKKGDKPHRKHLNIGGSASGLGKKDTKEGSATAGSEFTVMSPDNPPSSGCFGCISRKGMLILRQCEVYCWSIVVCQPGGGVSIKGCPNC